MERDCKILLAFIWAFTACAIGAIELARHWEREAEDRRFPYSTYREKHYLQ